MKTFKDLIASRKLIDREAVTMSIDELIRLYSNALEVYDRFNIWWYRCLMVFVYGTFSKTTMYYRYLKDEGMVNGICYVMSGTWPNYIYTILERIKWRNGKICLGLDVYFMMGSNTKGTKYYNDNHPQKVYTEKELYSRNTFAAMFKCIEDRYLRLKYMKDNIDDVYKKLNI